MCDLLSAPLPPDADLPGEDLYGLARLINDLGQSDRAEAAFEQSALTSQSEQVREMAMRDLAYLLKRQERRERPQRRKSRPRRRDEPEQE